MSDLDAIEARLNAATPGPWERGDREHLIKRRNGPCIIDAVGMSKENAEFVANAPTDIATLLREVGDLREKLASAENELVVEYELSVSTDLARLASGPVDVRRMSEFKK